MRNETEVALAKTILSIAWRHFICTTASCICWVIINSMLCSCPSTDSWPNGTIYTFNRFNQQAIFAGCCDDMLHQGTLSDSTYNRYSTVKNVLKYCRCLMPDSLIAPCDYQIPVWPVKSRFKTPVLCKCQGKEE